MAPEPTLPLDRPDPFAPPPDHVLLRSLGPIARVGTPDGQGAWLVTGFDPASTVLTDPRFGVVPPGTGGDGNPTLLQDGEPHARLRRLVARAFTPQRIAGFGPRIDEVADRLVGGLVDAGPPADLVSSLAAPLSIAVIGEVLGVDVDDIGRFRTLADAVSASDPFGFDAGEEEVLAAIEAWEALTGYAGELVAAKRRALGDDLVSDLVAVHDSDDGRLDDDELVALVATIVAAGYRPAAGAIAIGLVRLLTEDALGSAAPTTDDRRRRSTVVEEVLRIHAGQVGEPFPRYAQEEVTIAGVTIAPGDVVLVRLEAAHRDPARFTDPDHFQPGRSTSHIAFGRGPHHCLGAALARAELAAAFATVGTRLPRMRLHGAASDITWVQGIDAAPASVLVTWPTDEDQRLVRPPLHMAPPAGFEPATHGLGTTTP